MRWCLVCVVCVWVGGVDVCGGEGVCDCVCGGDLKYCVRL